MFLSSSIQASEDSIYDFKWLDQDKKIYVLQNRKYRKKNTINMSLGGGITTSGAFVDGTHIQGRLGYFFLEEFGFEGIFSKNFGSENSTAESVRNQGGVGSTPFRRVTQHYYGALLLWSPFYAKINTFNKILYFDWILGLGVGQITEQNNRDEFESNTTEIYEDRQDSHMSLMWQMGLKFYINKNFDIRFDFTANHYKAQTALSGSAETDESVYSHYDLGLSLGMRF